IHLAVDLLPIIARRGRKRYATSGPQRAANGTRTGTTSPFLTPRLLAAAADRGTVFLRFRAATAASKIRRHHLVHQRLVEFTTKHGVGNAHRLAVCCYLQFHGFYSPELRYWIRPQAFFTAG